ncbi:MAG: sigma-70 family RNA polymerase sigma factor [Pirellulales bacterium]
MSEVTQLIEAISPGDARSADKLLPLVYEELRRLAASHLALEKPGQTLQATALVHEAYLRLLGDDGGPKWSGRAHFFGAAAEAMRRILVDQARRKSSQKRGGRWQRVDIDLVDPGVHASGIDLLALDEALAEFTRIAPGKAELAKLRFFAGLTLDEAAQVLGISSPTADRHWRYARAWLGERLKDDESVGANG